MTIWDRVQKHVLGRSDIWFDGSRYMRRWLFGGKGTWGLRLHCIERSDAYRELHDHPFWYASLILVGGYYEHTIDGRRTWHGPGSIVFRSAASLHRLELLGQDPSQKFLGLARPAWTLVLRGRYARPWGFVDAKQITWMPWQDFSREREGRGERAGKFAAPSSL